MSSCTNCRRPAELWILSVMLFDLFVEKSQRNQRNKIKNQNSMKKEPISERKLCFFCSYPGGRLRLKRNKKVLSHYSWIRWLRFRSVTSLDPQTSDIRWKYISGEKKRIRFPPNCFSIFRFLRSLNLSRDGQREKPRGRDSSCSNQ